METHGFHLTFSRFEFSSVAYWLVPKIPCCICWARPPPSVLTGVWARLFPLYGVCLPVSTGQAWPFSFHGSAVRVCLAVTVETGCGPQRGGTGAELRRMNCSPGWQWEENGLREGLSNIGNSKGVEARQDSLEGDMRRGMAESDVEEVMGMTVEWVSIHVKVDVFGRQWGDTERF